MKYKIQSKDDYLLSVGEVRQLLAWASHGVKTTTLHPVRRI